MDNTVYVALSRQMMLRRELDIVANNIANADTTGFKVESLLAKTEPLAPAATAQGPKPVKFVVDAGMARNFGDGPMRRTEAPLDVAIEGMGFFKINTSEGERYTRDGHFRMNESGKLVTQAGDTVLGAGGGEIVIDPKNGPLTISAEGTLSQGALSVGKIEVVRFDDLASLEKSGDNNYRNVSNLQPTPAPDARVRQGALEGSNVRPIEEITKLMEITRAYERMAKMMDSEAELSRRSIERLGRTQ